MTDHDTYALAVFGEAFPGHHEYDERAAEMKAMTLKSLERPEPKGPVWEDE